MTNITIFDFNTDASLDNWLIVNDDVMGGISEANLFINEKGIGVFEGNVSLENYGGFASIRHSFEKIDIQASTKIILRIKGDKKVYQIRLKSNKDDYFVYTQTFQTSGQWETVEVNLSEMYPVFRGRKLRLANYANQPIEEIGILISNKVEETFRLEIDQIELL